MTPYFVQPKRQRLENFSGTLLGRDSWGNIRACTYISKGDSSASYLAILQHNNR